MQHPNQSRKIEPWEIPEPALELISGGEANRLMAPVDDP
jgi:hypothetical protein